MMFEYMSTSQFKAFEECEAAALAELFGTYNRQEKECFTEGKLFESIICGNVNKFIEEHPEMVSNRGTTKGELKSNYKNILVSAEAFLDQPVFTEIIARCEQQVIVTGEIAGIKFKGCVDFYDPKTGNGYDAKCVKDLKKLYSESDGFFVNWYFARGYHYQAAIYRELIRQTFKKVGRQHLIVATKESVPNVEYYQFTDEILDNAMEIIEQFAPHYNKIKKGIGYAEQCGKCDYCKSAKLIEEPVIIGEYE